MSLLVLAIECIFTPYLREDKKLWNNSRQCSFDCMLQTVHKHWLGYRAIGVRYSALTLSEVARYISTLSDVRLYKMKKKIQ